MQIDSNDFNANCEIYSCLLDNLIEGVVVYKAVNQGEDFVFLDMNKSGLAILGLNKEDILNKSLCEVFPGIKQFGLFEVLQKVYRDGETYHHPVRQYNDDALTIWTENWVYKLSEDELVVVFRDLTEQKRNEEELRKSEAKFKAIVETTSDLIWEIDLHGVYTYCSPKIKDMLGYDRDFVIGKSVYDLMPEQEAVRVKKIFTQIIENREVFDHLENIVVKKDGSIILLERSGIPVFDDENVLTGYRGIDRDITKRKKLEEDRDNFFNLSHEMLCMVDSLGNFMKVNPAWEAIVGWKREELEGNMLVAFIHRLDKERTVAVYKDVLRNTGISEFKNRFRCKDGSYKWVEWTSFPINGKEYIYCTARDITSRHKAEQELFEKIELLKLNLDIFKAFSIENELRGILNLCARAFIDHFHALYVSIWICGATSNVLELKVILNKDNISNKKHLSIAKKFVGKIGKTKEPVVIEDIGESALFKDDSWFSENDLQAFIGLPLIIKDELIGVIAFLTDDIPSKLSLKFLDSTCFQLAISVQNSILNSLKIDKDKRFVNLMEMSPLPLIISKEDNTENTEIIFVNNKFTEYYGYTLADIKENESWWRHAFPDEQYRDMIRTEWRARYNKMVRDNEDFAPMEFELRGKDNTRHYVEARVSYLEETSVVVLSDLTEIKNTKERLLLSASVFENTIEGIAITNHEGVIEKINPAFTEITGYLPEEAIGQKVNILKSDRHEDEFYGQMWDVLLKEGRWSGEIWNRRKNGEAYPEWLSIMKIDGSDDDDNDAHYISLFHDITERKRSEQKLQQLSYHDALTNLPNRQLFNDRLSMAIHTAGREGKFLAVLSLDLDNFKNINDSFGHYTGDILLQKVAIRLKQVSRNDDTIARFGGDEFTIILSRVNTKNDVIEISQRIISAFKSPFVINDYEFFMGVSIGITIYPTDGKDAVTLIKNADMALYRAKKSGKNTYAFFTATMNELAMKRVRYEIEMRRALQTSEFVVYYQPKIDLHTGKISGMEALVRWQKPDGEVIPPNEFIPIAEESGLIIQLGELVLRTACYDTKKWHEQGFSFLSVAVNLSARQFQDSNLISIIKGILLETDYPSLLLNLEITENIAMKDVEKTIKIMRELTAMGIKISLDDFGTGYSSLNYLKRFPFHILKIDKSFVREIPDDPDDTAIAIAILSLARNLNLQVVAEGIETMEQLKFMRDNACDEIQGYIYSKPLPADEFTKLLISDRSLPLE